LACLFAYGYLAFFGENELRVFDIPRSSGGVNEERGCGAPIDD